MYKLPSDFDGAFFIGRTLEFITFSENSVAFAFDRRVSITVESSLQHQFGSDAEQGIRQSVPLTESRLMQLLGCSVVQAKGDENGTLTIMFDNGHVLKVFDDQTCYESYAINDGKHENFV